MKQNKSISESRGISINFEYAIAILVALIIFTGTTGVLSASVDTRRDTVAESKMNTISAVTSSTILETENHREQLRSNGGELERLETKIDIPNRLQDEGYTIVLWSSTTQTKVIVKSGKKNQIENVETTFPEPIKTESSAAPAGDAWLVYDGYDGKYSLESS